MTQMIKLLLTLGSFLLLGVGGLVNAERSALATAGLSPAQEQQPAATVPARTIARLAGAPANG